MESAYVKKLLTGFALTLGTASLFCAEEASEEENKPVSENTLEECVTLPQECAAVSLVGDAVKDSTYYLYDRRLYDVHWLTKHTVKLPDDINFSIDNENEALSLTDGATKKKIRYTLNSEIFDNAIEGGQLRLSIFCETTCSSFIQSIVLQEGEEAILRTGNRIRSHVTFQAYLHGHVGQEADLGIYFKFEDMHNGVYTWDCLATGQHCPDAETRKPRADYFSSFCVFPDKEQK